VPFCRQTPLTLKALRAKDYPEEPQTLGEHLKKRRRKLGLLQREAAERMGIQRDTYVNWEKDKTMPVASQFRPVVAFLGYDPMPVPVTVAERVHAKRRTLGATHSQIARYLGWDPGTLTRYLNWHSSASQPNVGAHTIAALTSDDWPAVNVVMAEVEAAGLWPSALFAIRSIQKPILQSVRVSTRFGRQEAIASESIWPTTPFSSMSYGPFSNPRGCSIGAIERDGGMTVAVVLDFVQPAVTGIPLKAHL
jgi:DNA-binding transcriptional regulator YiaG